MDSRVVFTIIIGFLTFVWYRTRGRNAEPVTKLGPVTKLEPVTKFESSDCKKVLACTGYSNAKSKNLNSMFESRAIPNERLVRAYDIDNAFTTRDDERYKNFNKEAVKSINMTEDEVSPL